MNEYTVEISTFLKSEYWLNKLPKDINIPAIDLSGLCFVTFALNIFLYLFKQRSIQ